jgi:circadian clock protein KaiC
MGKVPAAGRARASTSLVDGVILLSSMGEGLERERYVEIHELPNTAHQTDRHAMTIGHEEVSIFPRHERPRT